MTSCLEKVDDFFLKSLQVNRCYEDDWNEMKSVFTKYGLSMNQHGPIITINQRKNIKICDNLTQTLANLPEYSSYRPKEIFIVLLRAYPTFSRILSYSPFEEWVFTRNSGVLEELLGLQGTLKSTDKDYERMIRDSLRLPIRKLSIDLEIKKL